MADSSKDTSPTPRQAALDMVGTLVSPGLIPVWIKAVWQYQADQDASAIWAAVGFTVIIGTIVGGGTYLGFRSLRRRKR